MAQIIIMSSLKLTHLLPAAAFATAFALALSAPLAHAQPDPNNAPKADNPGNRAVRPNNRVQMTPEQRDEAIKRFMKSQIERAGVTDETQQDAVIEYINGETDARQDLQDSARDLAMAQRNEALTDVQIAGLLNVYLGKIDDDKARRTVAQKKLSETVDMLKVPRLETMLVLMGAWDDAPNMSGGGNWMGRGRGNQPRQTDKPVKKTEAA